MIIENRSGRDAVYKIEIAGNAQAHFARAPEAIPLPPASRQDAAGDRGSRPRLSSGGMYGIRLRVSDDKNFKQEIACRLLGPVPRGGEVRQEIAK